MNSPSKKIIIYLNLVLLLVVLGAGAYYGVSLYTRADTLTATQSAGLTVTPSPTVLPTIQTTTTPTMSYLLTPTITTQPTLPLYDSDVASESPTLEPTAISTLPVTGRLEWLAVVLIPIILLATGLAL